MTEKKGEEEGASVAELWAVQPERRNGDLRLRSFTACVLGWGRGRERGHV